MRQISDNIREELDELKEELDLVFKFDIFKRSQERKYIDARRVFVNVVYTRYGLHEKYSGRVLRILSPKMLADYMGWDRSSIIPLVKNFDVICIQSPNLKIIYEKCLLKSNLILVEELEISKLQVEKDLLEVKLEEVKLQLKIANEKKASSINYLYTDTRYKH